MDYGRLDELVTSPWKDGVFRLVSFDGKAETRAMEDTQRRMSLACVSLSLLECCEGLNVAYRWCYQDY